MSERPVHRTAVTKLLQSTSSRKEPIKRLAALSAIVLSLGLLFAACGSDDDPAVQRGDNTSTTADGGVMGGVGPRR